MKNLTKLVIISIFGLFGFGIFIHHTFSTFGTTVLAQTNVKPTPPDEKPTPKPTEATNKALTESAETGTKPKTDASPKSDKVIPKEFTLGTDSLSEYGESPFNHETHAFGKYSPDGKTVVGCIECHHTDQPKSALKPPLLTSEREILMTFETWQKSDQKVSRCRTCHFQDGDVPDDKEMPIVTYKDGDKETEKELNNELAYHINCNTCHDAAAALRPELKGKKGFATTKDCTICHKEN
jgi:hypothetical protein